MNKCFVSIYKFRYHHYVKRFKCSINNAINDKKLKWRTTEESYCEYLLSPEEEKELRKNHLNIISNNNINIDDNIIYESIKDCEKDNISAYYFNLNSNLNNLKNSSSIISYYFKPLSNIIKKFKEIPVINYLYKNIFFKYRVNIHIFISPIYERINNEKLFLKFNLNKNDVREIMYFLCIHVWIYCVKLNMINDNHLKVLLFEKVWDYYRALIMKYKISEFSFNTYLINMQEYSLGFCVGLDECISKKLYAGQIYHLLFNHIYRENKNFKNSKELTNLTIYCIRMYRFICLLPKENFLQAKFTWPDVE
ncbi:conserved Plasmodium protein, unknown function [Plasmodium gallinaceum]|uniref:Ubiquinol-cytochrome c chaperone domain-containing protein n=1 Tax=Plasmodium gallinaceum TaxID=5849 RepID=A0A1J1GTK4_PLAGA|nr:conserved Plasmodium protein, unknown function [Plasmodium gallinaceum]CRG95862.1 conserved Plasmodium protein, unknown function [Plasmodium gallinaceum]